jgi:hypothetical protein
MFFDPEASPFSTGVAGSDFFVAQSSFGVITVPGVCAPTGAIATRSAIAATASVALAPIDPHIDDFTML